MTYDEAIEIIKDGGYITRKSWYDRGNSEDTICMVENRGRPRYLHQRNYYDVQMTTEDRDANDWIQIRVIRR